MDIQTQEMKGRTRLKGVLDDLVQQSKEEREGEVVGVVDEEVEEAARDLLDLNDDGANFSFSRKRGRPVKSPIGRRGRKRMYKDNMYYQYDSENSDLEERHIPHVMTLFDRRVDLARFSVDTPLYVMCREWMSNNPQKLSSAHINQDHTPKPLPVIMHPNTLPSPTPMTRDQGGRVIRLDIPKPHPPHTTSQRELDEVLKKVNPDLSQLRLTHLRRWKEVRNSWRKASLLNQLRYSESIKRIKEMFQR